MRTKKSKLLSVLLALVIALSLFGCNAARDANQKDGQATEQPVPALDIAIATNTPSAASTPEPAPKIPASERFHEIDRAFFLDYVTNDGYTFHQMITDPLAFSIDPASVPVTFGDFSEEANQLKCELYAQYLERLGDIPRDELTQREQLTYDVLQQYMESCIDDAQFPYFYEPLTPDLGLQSNLPLALALYELHTEADVKNYLALLSDVPRYFEQIMVYEQKRAELGMFMTEASLDAVLQNLEGIIQGGDTLFLVGTFNDYIADVNGITEDKKAAYRQRNLSLITDSLIPSYEMLRDGLKSLRVFCGEAEGMYALGGRGLSYFETRLQSASCTLLTVEEALELLESTLNRLLIDSAYIYMSDPSVAAKSVSVTTGDTLSDLTYLEALSQQTLGALPKHLLTVEAVPEELEKQMSAAAYVIPALDDAENNVILINTATESATPMFTTAHETYFGHMYQYILHRTNSDLGLSQRVLSYGGLSEGWAQLGTELMIKAQSKFDVNYCMLVYENSLMLNTLIPAVTSILVNYKAYDAEQIAEYLRGLGISDPSYTQTVVDWAYRMPFYTFEYAIGYSMLSDMMLSAEKELADAFDQRVYIAKLMDLGPAYLNLLRERMDIWMDEQVAE